MKSKRWVVLTTTFLSLWLLPRTVWAQESTVISLSPPTFELLANPGDSLENVIRVTNPNDRPLTVVVERRNFTALGEEGSVGLTAEETSFSLASWITVTPAEAEIPAKSDRNFTFRTRIPLNAEPGGHFGSIIFKIGGAAPPQTGAAVSQELGALVLLRVAGETEEKASLESFSAEKDFLEYGPVGFAVRVRNEGNVHLKPTGTITISNLFGKEVAQLEIEPRNVLPEAVRRLSATWDQRLLLGRYTATASLTYGNQGQILTASTTFFGFPYKVGGAILAGLIILGGIIYRARARIRLALRVLFSKEKRQ